MLTRILDVSQMLLIFFSLFGFVSLKAWRRAANERGQGVAHKLLNGPGSGTEKAGRQRRSPNGLYGALPPISKTTSNCASTIKHAFALAIQWVNFKTILPYPVHFILIQLVVTYPDNKVQSIAHKTQSKNNSYTQIIPFSFESTNFITHSDLSKSQSM
jgi:hypothetical protein